jgi:3-hydroxybutyryl-CoA dehydrogenase
MTSAQTHTIGVIGAWTMGNSIAQVNEAVLAYGEGIASARNIDEALKLGCNHPTGPLAVMEVFGLAQTAAIENCVIERLRKSFRDVLERSLPA